MMLENILLLATYPDTFRTNKVIKGLQDKLDQQIKSDNSAARKKVTDTDSLIDYVETAIKRDNQYETLYPYFAWMYTKYSQGKLQLVEDILSKVVPALLKYHQLKTNQKLKSHERNIGAVETSQDLFAILKPFSGKKGSLKGLSRKEKSQALIDNGQAEVFYQDENIFIVIPKTKKAACHFGINTQWCISAKRYNEFKSYSEDGKFYFVIVKKTNKRYAVYITYEFEPIIRPKGKAKYRHDYQRTIIEDPAVGRMEIWDETDRRIEPKNFLRKYPIIKQIFKHRLEFKKYTEMSEAEQKKVYKWIEGGGGSRIIKSLGKLPADLQLKIAKKNIYPIMHIPYLHKNVLMHVLLKGRLREHWPIDRIFTKHRKRLTDKQVEQTIIRHSHLISRIEKPSKDLQMAILKNSSNIMAAYNKIRNPHPEATQYAAQHIKSPTHLKNFNKLPEGFAWHFLYKDSKNIRYIRSPTADMAFYAISQDSSLFKRYSKRLTPRQLQLTKRRIAGYPVPTLRIKPKGLPHSLWSNKQ